MKKILIGIIGLFVSLNLFAQDPFTIGLKAGGSIYGFNTASNYTPNSRPNYTYEEYSENTKPGFSFGIFSRIHVWEPIFFQPEVYYSRKTIDGKINYLITSGTNTARLTITKDATISYIDIPLLIHVKAVELRSGNLYAVAGPTISFIVSDKYEFGSNFGEIEDSEVSEQIENAFKNDFETTNYALQAGVGYEVNKFHFDLRYEAGLNEMSKGNYNMTSSALMLNIGLKFF